MRLSRSLSASSLSASLLSASSLSTGRHPAASTVGHSNRLSSSSAANLAVYLPHRFIWPVPDGSDLFALDKATSAPAIISIHFSRPFLMFFLWFFLVTSSIWLLYSSRFLCSFFVPLGLFLVSSLYLLLYVPLGSSVRPLCPHHTFRYFSVGYFSIRRSSGRSSGRSPAQAFGRQRPLLFILFCKLSLLLVSYH